MTFGAIVKRAWCIFVLCLTLVTSSLVFAGQFEEGLKAYTLGDFPAAIRFWQPLAEQGNIEASVRLGDIYQSGLGGHLDYRQASKWYHKAAANGDMLSQYKLGMICGQGWLGKTDYQCAAKWYRRAAAQGLAEAQYHLGGLYESGLGVKKDFLKAYFWKSLAEKHGQVLRDEYPDKTRQQWELRLTADQRAAIKKQVDIWQPTAEVQKSREFRGRVPSSK
jgi:TPR repeat protein